MYRARDFEPHGDYSLLVEDNLIQVQAFGAWNLEGKKRMTADLTASLKKLNSRRFFMLVDVSEFELGTPEFQQFGCAEKINLVKRGLRKTAYVNRGQRTAHLQQLKQMQPELLEFQWRIFSTVNEARIWLYGLSADSATIA